MLKCHRHSSLCLWLLLVLLAASMDPCEGAFGLGKKRDDDNSFEELSVPLDDAPPIQDEGTNTEKESLVNLEDPELLEAMEIFAGMSPAEMQETMEELKHLLSDDPEAMAAIESVFERVKTMDLSDTKPSLKDMVEEDEATAKTADVLKALANSEWDTIWDRQAEILDAVIESGQIDAEDAVMLKSSPEVWESTLKHLWNELREAGADVKDEL